ncbi:MAG: radical SAM protein, partial [Candidatus Rifleibacteriota bacterium]
MINISRIYAGHVTTGDPLRYGKKDESRVSHSHHFKGHGVAKSAGERRPVVVWNVSKRCNLRCIHCYTNSDTSLAPDELTFAEGQALIDDLAEFKIPALLLSGGEPLMRPDLFELAQYAVSKGLRPVLSTNGTLITPETAAKIKQTGFIYAGISLDGIGATNDHFRGMEGAFTKAMSGFRNCVAVGQRVGLRLTLTRQNVRDLDRIFDFLIEEKIPRACFYHLVYSGRGKSDDDLSHEESRQALDVICRRTRQAIEQGIDLDILTVDNHVDG